MIYWMFTDGRSLFATLLMPLLCAAPVALLTAALVLGTGIRRTDAQAARSRVQRIGLGICGAVVLLTVTAIFLTLTGDLAVQRGRTAASPWISVLVGAPRGINAQRLLIFAALLAMAQAVTLIALHSALRDGS